MQSAVSGLKYQSAFKNFNKISWQPLCCSKTAWMLRCDQSQSCIHSIFHYSQLELQSLLKSVKRPHDICKVRISKSPCIKKDNNSMNISIRIVNCCFDNGHKDLCFDIFQEEDVKYHRPIMSKKGVSYFIIKMVYSGFVNSNIFRVRQ